MAQKILVADDDADVQEILKVALEGAGYDVVTASNGEEALEAVGEESPDLIVLDVMMTQPDEGFYVAQKIKRSEQPIPIIMLTAVSQATGWQYDKDEEMIPVEEFIDKPVDPSTLVGKVQELLAEEVEE